MGADGWDDAEGCVKVAGWGVVGVEGEALEALMDGVSVWVGEEAGW